MRGSLLVFTAALMASALSGARSADWPQWRGPLRNGVAPDSPPLATAWPPGGPRKVWDLKGIPCGGNRTGGWGSPVISGGRVYLYVHWHPAEGTRWRARLISNHDMSTYGYPGRRFPEDLERRIDAARIASEEIAGGDEARRTAWCDEWVSKNLTPLEFGAFGGAVRSWLRVGTRSVATLYVLGEMNGQEFADDEQFGRALEAKGVPPDERARVLRTPVGKVEWGAVRDVVLCLDLATGREVWRADFPGAPGSNGDSGTPCVSGNRLYVCASRAAYCLAADTGKVIWRVDLRPGGNGNNSSFLVAGRLATLFEPFAVDAETGEQRFGRPAPTWGSSPGCWTHDGTAFPMFHDLCLDPRTCEPLWRVLMRGGSLTPTISGDTMLADADGQLRAYALSEQGPTKLWQVPLVDEYSNPVIYEGHVYRVRAAEKRGCGTAECLDLQSGQIVWQRQMGPVEYSSPLIADGKIVALTDQGRCLSLIAASPQGYRLLAKARIVPPGWKGLWPCAAGWTSPAIGDGKVVVRVPDRLVCFDLTPEANPGGVPPPAAGPANLALGMPAWQSSVANGAAATRATDGNTSGSAAAESVACTNEEELGAWWEVDLLRVYPIAAIALWPRTEGEPLRGIRVLVSERPFASDDMGAAVRQTGAWASAPIPAVPPDGISIPVGRMGRYVRVQSLGKGALALAEVQVRQAAP